MRIWQRNHLAGDISARVIEVGPDLFHAEASDTRERSATLEDRLRPTLDLAQARADEMARQVLGHVCQLHVCDEWHLVRERLEHATPYPIAGSATPDRPADSVLIVRRGRTAWADFLGHRLRSIGRRAEFHWDRRFADRRRAPVAVDGDRRRGDRRTALPAAWTTLHFVLVGSLDREA